MAGEDFVLERPGGRRDYPLRRGEDILATLQRRGFFRPAYRAELDGRRLRFNKPGFAGATVLDEESGEQIARFAPGARGLRLVVAEEQMRPEAELVLSAMGNGAEAFLDRDDTPLLTMQHLGGWKGEIASFKTAGSWPAADPDAGIVLAALMISARLVSTRDQQSAQQFTHTYYGTP